LSLTGIVVVFVFLASILFNDTLRLSGELQALPLSSSSSRSIFVPSTAVPIALVASILAWTLLFTGALHVRALVRWGILFGYLFFGFAGMFLGSVQGASVENSTLLLLMLSVTAAAILGLVLALILLPRLRLPLGVEFLLMLGLVGGLSLLNLVVNVQTTRLSSINFVSGYFVPDLVTYPRYLTTPLLFLAGAEMIEFASSLTSWGARSAERHAAPWVVLVLLCVLLGYRWLGYLLLLLGGVPWSQWLAWAGALLAGIVLIPIALWRMRRPFEDHVPLKLSIALILVLVLPQLLVFVAIGLATIPSFGSLTDPNAVAELDARLRPLSALSDSLRTVAYLGLAGAGLFVVVLALRRKRYTVAAFGMILAWTQLVWWFMENGRPLQNWRYSYKDIDLWILVALTALTVYWLVQRKLDRTRTLTLLGLALFGWVLNFTDFLNSPLALFFGFAGIFFTAFGILWGVLTAGGKFANFDSPAFPRLSRIVLYLGYVLLTVNATHWFYVTHDLDNQAFVEDLALTGLRVFGLTAAYLIFVERGRALLKHEA
jgi:hypothetical protein